MTRGTVINVRAVAITTMAAAEASKPPALDFAIDFITIPRPATTTIKAPTPLASVCHFAFPSKTATPLIAANATDRIRNPEAMANTGTFLSTNIAAVNPAKTVAMVPSPELTTSTLMLPKALIAFANMSIEVAIRIMPAPIPTAPLDPPVRLRIAWKPASSSKMAPIEMMPFLSSSTSI